MIQAVSRALPGSASRLDPLIADPGAVVEVSQPLETSTVELRPFFDELQSLAREWRARQLQLLSGTVRLPCGLAVLQLIERIGPQTVPQIARACSTSRQNSQILVNRLRRQSAVEFAPNPRHRRSALVQLTGQGRAFLDAAPQAEGQLLDELSAGISRADLAAASSLLNRLRALLKQSGTTRKLAAGSSARKRQPRAEELFQNHSPTELPYNLL